MQQVRCNVMNGYGNCCCRKSMYYHAHIEKRKVSLLHNVNDLNVK
jgi:hypothetical protein